jgi:thiamine pyrophosphate-dependent acetolactate synthase large subunit-like protein
MQKAIKEIMDKVTDECVITSCGYISREVYAYKDRARNFYVLGAMGSCLAIGLGLGTIRPDLKVIVIQGDGATLMSLGTLILNDYLELPNIFTYVLDNQAYASTGGQKTCSSHMEIMTSWNIDMLVVEKTSTAPRIPLTCKEIKERFTNAIPKIR